MVYAKTRTRCSPKYLASSSRYGRSLRSTPRRNARNSMPTISPVSWDLERVDDEFVFPAHSKRSSARDQYLQPRTLGQQFAARVSL